MRTFLGLAIKILSILGISTLTTGCAQVAGTIAGQVVGAATASALGVGEFGENYVYWTTHKPGIPVGFGRVVVYYTDQRRSLLGAHQKVKQIYAIDSDVCFQVGHSFSYADLSVGPHQVSSDGLSKPFGWQKGRYIISVDVKPNTITYVKIHKVDPKSMWIHDRPDEIDGAIAENELRDVPYAPAECKPNRAENRSA